MTREHAPGLEWRSRREGRVPIWVASAKARKAGYRPATVRLAAEAFAIEPTSTEMASIAAACRRLQAEANEFLSGRKQGTVPRYDGTLKSLIDLYQTHEASRYHALQPATQRTYTDDLRKLGKAIGARRLDKISGPDILGWHTKFAKPQEPGKPPRLRTAHGAMTMLRIVLGFGKVLGLTEAKRLADVMSEMRFELPVPREAAITASQVVAFRTQAHEMKLPSLALATAIMFEALLRQKDVIGEWIVTADAAPSGAIVDRGRVWRTGLLWGEHISRSLVLEKPTSKSRGRKKAVHDLSLLPMVMEELAHVLAEKRIGPVIVCESTGRPWRKRHFAERWREVAQAAGIPNDVWCMDARAGGITEGHDAGAEIDALRQAATHQSTTMTSRYNRNPIEKSRRIARLRVVSRT